MVKCAKCGETWKSDKHGKSLLKTKVSQKEVEEKAKELREEAKKEWEAKQPKKSILKQKPEKKTPEIKTNNFSVEKIKKLILWGSSLATVILLTFSLLCVVFYSQVIQIWPESQHLYISFGLINPPQLNSLFLRDIRSIRSYQDGAMHLIVTGKILNQSKKIQLIPEITVDALGPDGTIIKNWIIPPIQTTIKSAKIVSFSSAVLSPQETVSEVNLHFVETKNEDD